MDDSLDAIAKSAESQLQQKPPEPVAPAENPPAEAGAPSSLKQIRTFEGDVAEAIKKQNESLISIQRKEEKKREAVQTLSPNAGVQVEGESSGTVRALILALTTIVLIGGGGYGAYYAWTNYSTKTAPPIISTPTNQFVSASAETNIDASTLGRQSVINIVTEARHKDRGSSSLEQLVWRHGNTPDAELLSTSDFLIRLASHAPSALVRAFNPLFMFGVLGSAPGHAVMLIKLNSFENAFPRMLDWEPKIAEDILALFADEDTVGGTSATEEFTDKTIQNHDTRVLKDSSGNIVFMYGFFDNSILIMTDGEEAFRTVINRLQSQKLSR